MGQVVLATAPALGETRTATTAAGGTALSDTPQTLGIPFGTKFMKLHPSNFSTAVVVQFTLNPWLEVYRTLDALVTAPALLSDEAQGPGTISLDAFGALAAGDALYFGADIPFRGFFIDVANANGNASVMTVEFWNGTAWTAVTTLTDGTDITGDTLAQDGLVTFDVPATWVKASLRTIESLDGRAYVLADPRDVQLDLFLVRVTFTLALDADVDLNSIFSLNRSTDYQEIEDVGESEHLVSVGRGGIGCVEARTDAGTADLSIDVSTLAGEAFP